MSKLLSKVLAEAGTDIGESGRCLLHWCPGCRQLHVIHIEKPNRCNAVWKFDGNNDSPTISPSVNMPGYCHYFITAGKIIFQPDCRHSLAGQTVDLPAIPDDEID